WTDAQTRTLIEERRNRNIEYHNYGRNRTIFWNSIANRINQEHNTNFTGYHCKEKFSNLVRSYNAMCEYMAGSRRARRNRLGAQYFDEFRTHFWERSEYEFDRIRTLNTSNRRRNRDVGNTTPAPSVEEVEHQKISGPPPPIETLSPQPPRGEDAIASGVTDEAQNNNQSQDSSNYEVAVSGSNLTPDLLNLSLSRNESDAIMHDIGSQPLFHTESINEEER
ncbi:16623_t:CDS:2, partial [Gigaspora margarita]